MIRYAIYFLIAGAMPLFAQEKCWIYFADKGAGAPAALSKSYAPRQSAQMLGISAHALTRRMLRSTTQAPELAIDRDDLPVAPEYLAGLKKAGVTPLTESRWLNAVSAQLTEEARKRVLLLPGVIRVEPVRRYRSDSLLQADRASLQKSLGAMAAVLDYGPSFEQVDQMHVPSVHSLDITGRGVVVGMLDTGFRWRLHEALRNSHVIAEHDFIQNDATTSNEAGDAADQDDHGTKTMSVLGGFMPGQLIGPAYGASFLLGKTEYVPKELNSEEDNWVAGLEWLERNGADIVSSSLGYSEFDEGQKSYTYQEMDGRTAVTTKAAAVAARKGVLVCVAMGNEGNTRWHFLTAPADADSILAVGAVNAAGAVASFSSVGPTSDGRIKPDISARGVNDICASPSPSSQSSYTFNSGTSLATPLVAGAAALLLSARPELTPIEVRDALRRTATNAASPDNSIGWGIVDLSKALMANGLLVSAQLKSETRSDSSRLVSVHILSRAALTADSLRYHYTIDTGRTFISGALSLASPLPDASVAAYGGVYTFTLPRTATHFFVSAQDAQGDARRLPANAPDVLYDPALQPVQPAGPVPASFVLMQNFPNPFNARTTIRYALTRPSHVSIGVYDILGRLVARLVNEERAPGFYSVSWDAASVSSGIYFYSIRTGEFSETKKMVLIR